MITATKRLRNIYMHVIWNIMKKKGAKLGLPQAKGTPPLACTLSYVSSSRHWNSGE